MQHNNQRRNKMAKKTIKETNRQERYDVYNGDMGVALDDLREIVTMISARAPSVYSGGLLLAVYAFCASFVNFKHALMKEGETDIER